jgi:hypothetical protein
MNMIATSFIATLNASAGGHWFERGTLRFFRSRVAALAYVNRDATRAYFVSSEQDRLDGVRLYSLRVAELVGPKVGDVDTVGEFQAYATRAAADRAARAAALA